MAETSAELTQRARATKEQLIEDSTSALPSSPAYQVLTSRQVEIGVRCHRWTVANASPVSTDPVVYDWTDRVVLKTLQLSRNGFSQPVQGSGQVRLALRSGDFADLEWGSLLLHFWVVVTDLSTRDEAWFEYGSWAVGSQTRCVDMVPAPGLSERTLFDVRLYDRIGWLDIVNAVRWDVNLADGWALDTEIRRVFSDSDAPWGTVVGSAPYGGIAHDMSVRVDRAEPDFTGDNFLRYATGETTWLQIINDLSSIAIERGTLAYANEEGQFVVPEWHGLTVGRTPTPIWRFDSADPNDVVFGTPAVRDREVWNTPNHWIAIGTAELGGMSTTARGDEIRNVSGEYGIARTGRTVSKALRLETRDLTKLSRYARFVAYCDGQEALQVSVKTKWLPLFWHNEHVLLTSQEAFGDTVARRMVASEWTLKFDGKPMDLLLRQVPRLEDYTSG